MASVPTIEKKVTFRHKVVECENCLFCFHQKRGKLQEMEYKKIANTVRCCSACYELKKRNQHSEEIKLFLRHVGTKNVIKKLLISFDFNLRQFSEFGKYSLIIVTEISSSNLNDNNSRNYFSILMIFRNSYFMLKL